MKQDLKKVGLEIFDSLLQKWTCFGLDTVLRVHDNQKKFVGRLVNTPALSINDIIEISSSSKLDTDDATAAAQEQEAHCGFSPPRQRLR